MNLFEQTVNAVLAKQQAYSILRPAVEKEILHQDILRTLNKAGLLQKLILMFVCFQVMNVVLQC